ncbi:MAG: tripartite tricarboxylate transporter substrate binding protein [Eubacteriales bacterium]|nr:tripartite tricarboxylate transporter substrate binding protein [Eubacteriales bacterium]
MMKKLFSLILAAALVVSLAACGGSSSSSSSSGGSSGDSSGGVNWPTTTVSVVVPYNAGGDTDTYCRALFDKIAKKTGGTFVVTNLTGGSGMVAAMDVMGKKPDGYTILFNHTGASLVQEATGMAEFSYTDDFDNCATVAMDETYALVAVSPDGKYANYSKGFSDMNGLIEYAKAHPGELRYSTVSGSTTEYVGNLFCKLAGISFDNIDVGTSSGDRLAALLGGQVELAAFNYMNVADYIEAGDLVCFGVMAAERVDGIDFPTFKEQGFEVLNQKKYEVKFPKGTDPAIVEYLSGLCKEVTEDPEFAEVLKTYYAVPYYRDAAQMNEEDPKEVEDLKANLN